jgi:prolyl 4-hydroxylase
MAQRILGTHNDATLLLNDPYVIQFNNFIDDETIQFLIQYGNNNGFKRSTDVGPIDSFGENKQVVSNHRTSENTWCSGPCEQHHLVQRLNKRIEEITGIPQQNYESLQLLKYTRGQEYRLHHDIESDDVYSTAGARILTFFIYLNDVEGGETYFPTLDLKVKPKKGSAILWPHVLNDNVMKRDDRTYHAALPVVKGTKFAANAWVHSHDFKTPNLHGCTGAFD